MLAFQKAIRMADYEMPNMSFLASVFFLLWKFFIVASRVITMALFASQFKAELFLFIGFHYLVMLLWLIMMVRSPPLVLLGVDCQPGGKIRNSSVLFRAQIFVEVPIAKPIPSGNSFTKWSWLGSTFLTFFQSRRALHGSKAALTTYYALSRLQFLLLSGTSRSTREYVCH